MISICQIRKLGLWEGQCLAQGYAAGKFRAGLTPDLIVSWQLRHAAAREPLPGLLGLQMARQHKLNIPHKAWDPVRPKLSIRVSP